MAKLAVVGQDTSKLIDCSEAVPMAVPAVRKPATFPAGTGPELLQLSCNSPFPSLATDRELFSTNFYIALSKDSHSLAGLPTTIPECPDGDTNLNDCPS